MRGKPAHDKLEIVFLRIIPAHAGQTRTSAVKTCCRTDHPRACGANHGRIDADGSIPGSSPRMRGKQRERHHHGRRRRIIPAHAGQTVESLPVSSVVPDHPRACGANGMTEAAYRTEVGSSPRMRGKRRQLQGFYGHARIIPAHAGQTCSGRRF